MSSRRALSVSSSGHVSKPAATLGQDPPKKRQESLYSTTALQQCNDLVQLQNALLQNSLKRRREMIDKSVLETEKYEDVCNHLQREKVRHTQTKCLLSAEQEKAHLAFTEVQVLSRQLDREKATFEKAFGLLKSRSLSDSTKSETLLAKSSALESLVAGKDEAIARLEGQVYELTGRIREMKQAHKMELQDANVRIQQELYLAKHFQETDTLHTGYNPGDKPAGRTDKPGRTRTGYNPGDKVGRSRTGYNPGGRAKSKLKNT